MENFLLLWDELDDAATSLRLLWPPFFGFLMALALFAATIFLIMQWPLLVALMALVVAAISGFEIHIRRVVLRSDP